MNIFFAKYSLEIFFQIHCVVYHGNKEKLAELRRQMNEHRQSKKSSPIVIITAYHVIVSDKYEPLQSIEDISRIYL